MRSREDLTCRLHGRQEMQQEAVWQIYNIEEIIMMEEEKWDIR